jgi:hypothetical protein
MCYIPFSAADNLRRYSVSLRHWTNTVSRCDCLLGGICGRLTHDSWHAHWITCRSLLHQPLTFLPCGSITNEVGSPASAAPEN